MSHAGTPHGTRASRPHAQTHAKTTTNRQPTLYTTDSCPNCKIVKTMLDRKGIAYTVVDAQANPEEATRLGIQSVPMLFADGKQLTGLGPILGWVNNQK